VLDEVQKVPGWSEVVKWLWDADTHAGLPLKVVLLGCAYSGQVLSYQKMLGQLTDAGNTVTLAHYLELLQGAGMVAGLSKFARAPIPRRALSPKLLALNSALISALDGRTMAEARQDGEHWGRLVESCVGAHLFNTSLGANIELAYWRERNQEVDFVLRQGKAAVPIEVKSGRRPELLPGMEAFAKRFKPKRKLLVGPQGIALEDFLTRPAAYWLQ
jgi:hypothetical protein